MTPRQQEVWRLQNLGHWIVPCGGRKQNSDSSTPLASGYLQQRLDDKNLEAHFKINQDSCDYAVIPRDMIVLDLECRDGKDGLQDLKDLAHANGTTFDAITRGAYCTRTKSNGFHFWYRLPDGMPFNGSKYINERRSIEVKRGVCVHVPPSFGYTQEVPIGLGKDAPPLPHCIANLVLSYAASNKRADIQADTIPLGERRSALLSLAGSMHERMAMNEEELYKALIGLRDSRCEDPDSFTDEEVRSIAKDIGRKPISSYEGRLAAGDPLAKSVEALVSKLLPKSDDDNNDAYVVMDDDVDIEELTESEVKHKQTVHSIHGVRVRHLPKHVCRPNKIFDMWHDWAKECSPRYQPEMSTFAAITAIGTLMGRRWTTAGNRPIIYSLSLVGTGGGKTAAMDQAKALFRSLGKPEYMGMAKIGSDAGMISEIAQAGEIMWCWDEFPAIMRDWAMSNCPSYKDNIKTMLLEWFDGKDWEGKSLKDLNEVPRLSKPHPCLLAVAQPRSFLANHTQTFIDQGLWPRFLFTYNPNYVEMKLVTELKDADASIPKALVDTIKERMHNTSPSRIQEAQSMAKQMGFDENQLGDINKCNQDIEGIVKRLTYGNDHIAHAMSTRSYQKMIRLAMVHAFTADNFTGKITLEGLLWAKAIVVDHSDALINDILSHSGGDATLNKNIERVLIYIKKAGAAGVPHATLKGRLRMNEKPYQEALDILISDCAITRFQTKSGKPGYKATELE